MIDPTVIGYIAGAVAVIGAITVWGMLHVGRRWAAYIALIFEAVLTALFAYTVNLIYAQYSNIDFNSPISEIAKGVAYQRAAAGILSAMLFLAALVSIGYYMELQRGHE